MKRVASLFLPSLSIERLRRSAHAPRPDAAEGEARSTSSWLPAARLPENSKERARLTALRERLESEAKQAQEGTRIEDCSCPRAGGWRPGASWAHRETRQAEIDALPSHQRPPMRMLGRRSEAAEMPFKFPREGEGPVPTQERRGSAAWAPAGVYPERRPHSRRAGEQAPLVTTQRSGQRIVLAAVSPEAAALGLNAGMPVTQARVLVPGLDLRDADPDGDAALLTRLALFAARRWTPAAAPSGADGLWLDLSGVSHLFGGEAALCRRVLRFCARLGFTARIAIAGTTGAAHALARFGVDPITLCPSGSEAQAVAQLPLAALRLDDTALTAAKRFGIANIGELIAMPRGPLARRFGQRTLERIDQALGRVREPFDPIVPHEPPRALLRLLEPIATAEAIAQVLSDLMAMLVDRLERDGLGVRHLKLVCHCVDGREQSLAVGTVSATRNAAHLVHLLGLKTDQIEPGFGIEAMELVAVRSEPLRASQIGHDLGGTPSIADLPPLVDRIAGRIGADRLFRATSVESDVPERSVRHTGPLEQTEIWPPAWPRPTRLLARPERIDKVIAELPDQPPLRFSWRGKVHRVRKADGPERIFGEWWRRAGEAHAVRDYFQVEDEEGARFWLFRRGDGIDLGTGDLSWWMHGAMG